MKGKYLQVKKACVYVFTKILLSDSGVRINYIRMNEQGKCEVDLLSVKEILYPPSYFI